MRTLTDAIVAQHIERAQNAAKILNECIAAASSSLVLLRLITAPPEIADIRNDASDSLQRASRDAGRTLDRLTEAHEAISEAAQHDARRAAA